MKLIETKKAVFHYQESNIENPKGSVIFIHDFASNCDYFNEIVQKNKELKKYNYYGIELPGSKYNPISKEKSFKEIDVRYLVDYCIEIIENKNLERIILIGHSFGGLIATRVANRFQKKVKKLLLISPMNSFMFFYLFKKRYILTPKTFDRNLELNNLLYYNIIECLGKDNIEKIISKDTKYKIENRPFLKHLRKNIFSLYNMVAARKEETLIKQKTLIISGIEDKIVPKNSLIFAFKKSSRPHIQIDYFNNVGHIPFKEDAEYFSDVLEEFIEY